MITKMECVRCSKKIMLNRDFILELGLINILEGGGFFAKELNQYYLCFKCKPLLKRFLRGQNE